MEPEALSLEPSSKATVHTVAKASDVGLCSSFQRLLPWRLSNTMPVNRETCVLRLANPGHVGELLLERGPLPMGLQREVKFVLPWY